MDGRRDRAQPDHGILRCHGIRPAGNAEVLPHLVDPNAAFEKVRRLTKPGGMILVESWNCQSWTARILGKRWHEYSPPSVLHWFSPATLRRATHQYGFEHIAMGRPTKRLNGAHLKSVIDFNARSPVARPFLRLASLLVPDRLSIPYPAEDLFWVLLRRSI
jgi:hypothetical protein